MLVRGITREDLEAAVEVASSELGNTILLDELRPANKKGTAFRFRVKVADEMPAAPAGAPLFGLLFLYSLFTQRLNSFGSCSRWLDPTRELSQLLDKESPRQSRDVSR